MPALSRLLGISMKSWTGAALPFSMTGQAVPARLRQPLHAHGAQLSVADRVLDADPSTRSIDARLLELEALAIQNGNALGSGFAYPVTVDALVSWTEGLEQRGYQLAPASHVARLRSGGSGQDT